MDERSCTCHPDDNPPRPCARKYALADCRRWARLQGMIEAQDRARGRRHAKRSERFSTKTVDELIEYKAALFRAILKPLR